MSEPFLISDALEAILGVPCLHHVKMRQVHNRFSSFSSEFHMFRTITSKFDGVCKRCKGRIPAGSKCRWAKFKGAYHMSSACSASLNYGNAMKQTPALVEATSESRAFDDSFRDFNATTDRPANDAMFDERVLSAPATSESFDELDEIVNRW